MTHLAILTPSWRLLPKILSGKKTVETRWYQHRAAPWDKITAGETVYFKNSGQPVTAKAIVAKVEQFSDLTDQTALELLQQYSQQDLGTTDIQPQIKDHVRGKRYAIIVHLRDPQPMTPFEINKTGYGAMAAWLCVDTIDQIKRQ